MTVETGATAERDRRRLLLPHRLLVYSYVTELGRSYQRLGLDVVYGPENLFESTARYDIVHLQWPEDQYRAYGSGPVEARATSFIRRLDEHKRRGSKLAWTVHNVIPHEHVGSSLDAKVYQDVIDRSDVIVHHCAASLDMMAKTFKIPSSALPVVVHFGNYGAYPDNVSKDEARKRLAISTDATVYLCFGALRGYKGFDTLLRAFRRARVKNKFLLVAGYYTGVGGIKGKLGTLRLLMVDWLDRRSRLDLKMIDDEDVQLYFRAADAVVLSHSRGLNPGVAVLGMTFGKVVIGPDLGCIGHVLEQGENLIYPANDTAALTRAMERVPGFDVARAGATNRRVAASWDWSEIGRRILDALDQVQTSRAVAE